MDLTKKIMAIGAGIICLGVLMIVASVLIGLASIDPELCPLFILLGIGQGGILAAVGVLIYSYAAFKEKK